MGEPAGGPRPRLCHIVKWADFDGYGFNLHAEKNRPGQYIGKVDAGSPAEMAGLREGDKIVEVNGVNINQENHKQVVGRIKAEHNQTRLLVVDQACEAYYKERNIVITGSMPNILVQSSQRNQDQGEEEEEEEFIDTRIQKPREVLPPPSYAETERRPEPAAASRRNGRQESADPSSPAASVKSSRQEADGSPSASRKSSHQEAAPAVRRKSSSDHHVEEEDDVIRRPHNSHHEAVHREDSLMSDRTLSNRSSVSSGKEQEVEAQPAAASEDRARPDILEDVKERMKYIDEEEEEDSEEERKIDEDSKEREEDERERKKKRRRAQRRGK